MPLSERTPDPERLLGAYFHSAASLNYVRTLLSSGFASLHHPENWSLDHVQSDAVKRDYQAIVSQLLDALGFMSTIGAEDQPAVKSVDLYVAHEGLLLEYEQRLTRPVGPRHYNLGAHYLWIGDRTRQLDGGHVEYFRGMYHQTVLVFVCLALAFQTDFLSSLPCLSNRPLLQI